MPGPGTAVAQRDFVDLAARARGDEKEHFGPQAVLFTRDAGIAHSMPARIEIQGRAAGFPAGIPDRIAVLDIEVAASAVHRHTVVAVAQNAAEAGVTAETVAARRIGNQGKEVIGAQIVDPGPGRCRVGDDVFPLRIVEMTVLFHIRIVNNSCEGTPFFSIFGD